jgi:hypothetical protein
MWNPFLRSLVESLLRENIEICGRVTVLWSLCFSFLVVNKGLHRSGCNCCGIFKYLQSVALEISLQFPRYDADIVVGYSL